MSTCTNLCGKSLTESQLTCLEGTSCAVLGASSDLPANCSSSSTGDAGGGGGDAGGGGSDNGKLGDKCPCSVSPGSPPCQNLGTGSGCSSGLTCFGTVDPGPLNNAKCSVKCTPDPMKMNLQGSCTAGFDCTDFLISGSDYGNWCTKQN